MTPKPEKEGKPKLTPTQQFEENTGASFEAVTGVPPRFVDFDISLNIPDDHRALLEGLTPLEFEAAVLCHVFIVARKLKNEVAQQAARELNNEVAQQTAKMIGDLMAGELAKGNFKLPRIISEGLTNLQNGKPFKGKRGRKPSNVKYFVLLAFYQLKKTGISQPSQSEVVAYLAGLGQVINPDHVSKIFEDLGLRAISSDGREATSQAGKRKRGKR